MCGIAGILSGPSADAEALDAALTRMLLALRHRGPDDCGTRIFVMSSPHPCRVLLAHTRLAVLDPTRAGRQPMHDPVTGNWIVFNGEIYNFQDLRAELGGEPWRSRTDTEVLLRAYRRWGERFLEQLRGMYALALWDANAKRFLLARDPLGIKPLYYTHTDDRFLFASEVRALLAGGCVDRHLDAGAVQSYLRFGGVEEPMTIVAGVTALASGALLRIHFDGTRIQLSESRPSSLLAAVEAHQTTSVGERRQRLRKTLEDSVRAHLTSDVPVAAFLSGGIDSSAIVALTSRVAGEPLQTFSVVFAEKSFSEAACARLVAQRCGTRHTEVPVSEGDLVAVLPRALAAMDQPTMNGINTYVVSRAVHEAGVKVALSGLGGDELFGGYPSFARALSLERNGVPQRIVRGVISRLLPATKNRFDRPAKSLALLAATSPEAIYLQSRRLFAENRVHELCALVETGNDTSALPGVPPGTDAFRRLSLYELTHYMKNILLRDTDCMGMAHSLEVRVPFLDRNVVAEVLAEPFAGCDGTKRPKPLLLDAVGELLPPEVWRRPKRGFVLPFDHWMRGRLKAEIGATLTDPTVRSAGLAPAAVARLWEQFLRYPKWTGWTRPWALYVLTQWCTLNSVRL